MLAAYRGELPDTVPVAPEFWYYLPARLLMNLVGVLIILLSLRILLKITGIP